MRSLTAQYEDCIAEVYANDKRERELLMRFLTDYSKEEDLVDYVMEKMAEGDFKMGDEAKTFFSRCADEIFKIRLKRAIKAGNKAPESIKKYHPLFGASWWTT